jgi:hypothetical protein
LAPILGLTQGLRVPHADTFEAIVAGLARLQRLFRLCVLAAVNSFVAHPAGEWTTPLSSIHRIATYLLIVVRLHYGVSAYPSLHGWEWFHPRKSQC